MGVRPTLRCLRDDLRLPLSPIDDPLDEVDHPLLRKASDQFADSSGTRERIRAIDDAVIFKTKVQRWRGAVWTDKDERPWLIAAGWREDGSPQDFYEAFAHSAKAARARYNAEHSRPLSTRTRVADWLPTNDDLDRYHAEAGVILHRQLKTVVRTLVRDSLLDGHEHAGDVAGATVGVLVRADEGHETYVALRIVGSVPDGLLAVILALVPGCDRDGWGYEFAMPHRPLAPNEQVWSNMMDPTIAAQLLED